MPELLTVFFSAVQGLFDTGVYNIISSNVINLVQYTFSIVLNKNGKYLKNKALKIELGIVAVTIIIPILMMVFRNRCQYNNSSDFYFTFYNVLLFKRKCI